MISIIVPIYNAEKYLEACVMSLLAQTEQDIRILLVDDDSTDSSPVIARQIASTDPRIEVYEQAHAGQSAARNLGLAHCQGEYVAFVDADDRIDPDWCTRHLAAIEGVDYVQSGYVRTAGPENRETPDRAHLPGNRYQFISPCMRLYRREALRDLRFAEGFIYEDVLFSMDLWTGGASCRMIDYTGYRYTLNPASTTSCRHPEAEQRLYAALREKKKHTGLRGKLIILYTLIRLQLHFIRS